MQSCPLHRDVVLESTPEGLRCFICGGVIEAVEVDEPATKILEFRRPAPARREERPLREFASSQPIHPELERHIQALSDALRLDPTDPRIVQALAETLEQAGRHADAADVYFRRGHACMENGLAVLALPFLRQVLRLDPTRDDARRLLIEACFDQRLLDEVVRELEQLWIRYRITGQRARSYEAMLALKLLEPEFQPSLPGPKAEWSRCFPIRFAVRELLRNHDVTRLDIILRDVEFIGRYGSLDWEVLGSWVECRVYGEGREAMTKRLTQLHADDPDHLHWMLMLARLLDGTERQAEAAELYKRLLPLACDEAWRFELGDRTGQLVRLR
ncbi:MAG: tetratricopeptide repeat protein [Deltaproteobacteria bacterium]|nr:tetratricopeptide repeat protein [Deltaproteobacteria bacterium]